MSLNDLRDEALEIATSKGFTDATIGEDLMLMVTELAEAMEDHRKGDTPGVMRRFEFTKVIEVCETHYDHDNYPYIAVTHKVEKLKDPKPCGIDIEIADAMIRILHFCGKHDIPIHEAVRVKMDYNRSREWKHGKKI